MSIFYVDYENGDNANDGTTWALAWKDITLGATALRIAAGDEIRTAKSPDPTSVGNATWTDGNDTLVLASALTKSVVDGGETWTPSANVTAGVSGNRKIGALATYISIADAFTTGKAVYYALGSSQDFSGYEQISFQIKISTVTIIADVVQIKLCSDTTGDTAVNTIDIPALAKSGRYYTITINTSAALGSAIQSVAIYTSSDVGIIYLEIGQIIACKASSADDSLTLSSLIGKSASATDLERLPIRGIIGTTVYFDSKNTAVNSTQGKYAGDSETVTTYKVEPIQTTPKTSNSQSDFIVNDSGTVGSWITYTGGWNTGTTIRDGLTWFDGQNGEGAGLYLINKSYINIENFGFTRYDTILVSSGIIEFINITSIGQMDEGILIIDSMAVINNGFIFGCTDIVIDAGSIQIKDILISCNNYSITATGTFTKLINIKCYYTVTADINAYRGSILYMKNCILGSTTPINTSKPHSIYSNRHDDTDDNHKQWLTQGNNFTQITNRHTASGIAWEMVALVNDETDSPLPLKIADALVKTGILTTATVWVKKEHATTVDAKLIILADEIAGVSADVEDVKADDVVWEQLSIQFTPTKTGVVEIWVYAWGTTGTDSIYVDDFDIT